MSQRTLRQFVKNSLYLGYLSWLLCFPYNACPPLMKSFHIVDDLYVLFLAVCGSIKQNSPVDMSLMYLLAVEAELRQSINFILQLLTQGQLKVLPFKVSCQASQIMVPVTSLWWIHGKIFKKVICTVYIYLIALCTYLLYLTSSAWQKKAKAILCKSIVTFSGEFFHCRWYCALSPVQYLA